MDSKKLKFTLLVCALGYFVDIYDLVLFSVIRKSSLISLGVSGESLLSEGVRLINMQMIGMLLGGMLWGILGDRKGRVSVLFGSIFMYSAANIANAFVTNVEQYAWLRLIAGIGLAGELGAAVTLVSEMMSKETRGIGTTLIASVGVTGAIAAGLVGQVFSWQTAYVVGGVLGFLLLFLRMGTFESGMFEAVKKSAVSKGNFLLFFATGERVKRYLACILIGVPIWFVIGIVVTFSPEISRELGVQGEITGAYAILFAYIGLSLGDLASGMLSQVWKTRKKAVLVFLILTTAMVTAIFSARGVTVQAYYALCVGVGFGVGYWAMFVTIASEQFGTNLRATAATSIPNFVRGSVVPLTLTFTYLRQDFGMTLVGSAAVVGVMALVASLLGLSQLRESFGKDLDFLE